MPDQGTHQSPAARRARGRGLLLPLAAVAGALALTVAVYLGYDLVSMQLSPCEAIYRQTSVSLTTKIKFLKAEGEVQIGKEPLIELDERAQITALNLKTCCTVLAAGKLDPEQFLQCKSKARTYEARVDDVAAIVQAVVKAQSNAQPAASPKSMTTASLSTGGGALQGSIQAARTVSQDFNREVIEVQRAQSLETLKSIPPRHVEISAQELEPNDDGLSANLIELGKWITGTIGSQKDADFFAFKTLPTYRDLIRIELENRSTTLEPRIELYDADKASLGEVHQTTKGADLAYSFVGAPDRRYMFRVSNYYGSSVGAYLVRVIPTKAYDAHEPNDDILSARPIATGTQVSAKIMDKGDADFFRVETSGAQELLVEIRNSSTTLRPAIGVFDAAKTSIGSQHTTTAGGDISHTFKAQPRAAYYIRVGDYYSDAAGAYVLTVSAK
jgi:hypothetical protein